MIDFPQSPTVGQLFTVGNTTWVWDGAKWTFSTGGAGVTLAIADVAPINPQLGSLWWDSIKGQLYLWYPDANSAQWVPTTNQLGGGYLPLTGGSLTGDLAITGDTNTLTLNGPSNNWAGIRMMSLAGQGNWIGAYIGGLERWEIDLGNGLAETGGNTGSNFQINRSGDNGVFIDNPLIIRRSDGAVTIGGTRTNDNANTNAVGEVISSLVNTPGVTLTTSVAANVTNISLTPGDWDVSGELYFVPSAAPSGLNGGITSTSATLPGIALNASRLAIAATFTVSGQVLPLATCRVSISATTPYYLVAQAVFASGTCTCYGKIWARRAR